MCATHLFPTSSSNTSITYNVVSGTAISDDLMESCAQLFSTNYGIWGEEAKNISKYTKPGQSVKMTGSKLRSQSASIPDHTVLVWKARPPCWTSKASTFLNLPSKIIPATIRVGLYRVLLLGPHSNGLSFCVCCF
ncbi:hypothetical protein BDR04DRAFT_342091 [Suillus decipiens]|nr:hypothetical protein BDR04DRAFT_342091 [Suillus decipiens]